MTHIEILPCPFCRSDDLRMASPSECWVDCQGCDAEGPTAFTKEDAAQKWNAVATLRDRCEKAEEERDSADSAATFATARALALITSLAEARAEALEEAAMLADNFGWTLPMFTDAAINEATDDAACAVQSQIADAIRALKSGGTNG